MIYLVLIIFYWWIEWFWKGVINLKFNSKLLLIIYMDFKSKKRHSNERGYHKAGKHTHISPQVTPIKSSFMSPSPSSPLSPRTILKISSPSQVSSPTCMGRMVSNLSLQLTPSTSKKPIKSPVLQNLSSPYTPKQVQSLHSERFNALEKIELSEYQMIYFLGSDRKIVPVIEGINNGYDNDKGDYLIIEGDHIAYRYEIIKIIGRGSFGVVVECFDYKRNEKVAMKIIKNKKRFFQQATVEIKVLQQLRENDLDGKYNVVKMKNYFLFRNHICICFELLSMNLFELLKQNAFEGLSLTLIHRFAVQILVCLQYIGNEKVIHCDLKPENILLKDTEKALISVIDFGSACFEHEKVYYYIQSRFYRAPEVILGANYTTAIDMWSLGCILAELFTGKPLFCGESEHMQLICIMQVLGVPGKALLSRASKRENFFDLNGNPKIVANKKGVKKQPESRRLEEVLQGSNENFVDFIRKCLTWEAKDRMKPLQGLDHPWIVEGLKR